jgi:hypothetical protein
MRCPLITTATLVCLAVGATGSPAERGAGACEAVDGLQDGLIQDRRACDFDPKTLQFLPAEAEVAVLEKWCGGAKNAAGEQLYPGGILPGSEPFWRRWLTGDEQGGGGLIRHFGEGFVSRRSAQHHPPEPHL